MMYVISVDSTKATHKIESTAAYSIATPSLLLFLRNLRYQLYPANPNPESRFWIKRAIAAKATRCINVINTYHYLTRWM